MNEKSVDYLQYSMFASKDKFYQTSEQIPPVRNYRVGFRQADGTRIYFGNALSKKALFILDGRTLHNQRINGESNEDYIERVLTDGAKVSRIDLQVTQFVQSDLITPSDYLDMVREGQVLSAHVKHGVKWLSSLDENYRDNVETLYIGDMKKRGKRGIVRAYDKGVEMDLTKFLISRLEVEDKRDNAHTTAKRIASGVTVSEAIKSRFDIKNDRWQDLIGADSIDMTRGKQIVDSSEQDKMDSRWKWLIGTVAKSLGQAIAHDEINGMSEDNKLNFERAMAKAYSEVLDSP